MIEPLTGSDLITQLTELGLQAGQQVLLHSSLSSLGNVIGGADTVIDALLEVLGPEGTLVVPTLTGHKDIGPGADVMFDVAATPSWTGRIPETLRQRDGAIRSLHPTHSVAAWGSAAESLTRGHEETLSPCGIGSPYVKLASRLTGKILLLGVGHNSNTTLHSVEELAGVTYHLQDTPTRAIIRSAGRELVRTFWPHAYGTPRRFPMIEPLLIERGAETTGPVGSSLARLVSAEALIEIGCAVLRIDPEFLIEPDVTTVLGDKVDDKSGHE